MKKNIIVVPILALGALHRRSPRFGQLNPINQLVIQSGNLPKVIPRVSGVMPENGSWFKPTPEIRSFGREQNASPGLD